MNIKYIIILVVSLLVSPCCQVRRSAIKSHRHTTTIELKRNGSTHIKIKRPTGSTINIYLDTLPKK